MLDTISKPKDMPVLATICGDSGMGKTTLAATFPNPVVIRAEDGLQSIEEEKRPYAFPLLHKVDVLWDQIMSLIQDEHDYQTLIVDSVTALERLFVQSVIDSDPRKPINIQQALGGYGSGNIAVGALHQRLRKAAEVLRKDRNMNIVFVAHAALEKIELPDQDTYHRYSLKLGKSSISPYIDEVDLVGFLRLETFVTGDGDRKKATSDGTRELITYATAANVSKNRYGITSPLVVQEGENPLFDYIPSLKLTTTTESK